MTKTIQRRNVEIVQLHIEINHALHERLQTYTVLFGMTQRDIIAEALLIWLNTQDSITNKKAEL